MLDKRLKEIREELNSFEDDLTKYSFLVALSAYIKADQPELMTPEHLHKGCQSQVWIEYHIEEDRFKMNATSDTLIIRGVLYVMMELFNDVSPQEIAESHFDFLDSCGIKQHFSDSRVSGIRGIVDSVISYCKRSAGTGQKA